jgi:hypothetical protein
MSVLEASACSGFGSNKAEEDAGGAADAADRAAAPPPYPATGGGIFVDRVIENVRLEARVPPSTQWKLITLEDYFDPYVTKGIYAIVIEVNVVDPASPSADESVEQMMKRALLYANRGAVLIELLRPGAGSLTQSHGDAWIEKHKITFTVALDPSKSIKVDTTPTRIFINPRSMRITAVVQGVPAGDFAPELDALLESNNAPKGF